MVNGKPWSAREKETAITMFLKGSTYPQIARALNRPKASIAGVLFRAGVKRKDGQKRLVKGPEEKQKLTEWWEHKTTLKVTPATATGLREAARDRGVTPDHLADLALSIIIEDNLWKAVLADALEAA